MIPRQVCRLCVITDPALGHGLSHVDLAQRAIEGGASMIQLRDTSAGPRQLLPQARKIATLCRERAVPFIVNDRLDLALAAGARLVNETLTVPAGSAGGTPVRPAAVSVTSSRVNPQASCPHWSNDVRAAYWAGVGSTEIGRAHV